MHDIGDALAGLVAGFDFLLGANPDEELILTEGARLLERLVARDDWLRHEFAQPDPARYAQFPLYRDPLKRFSVASLVWSPGQSTPIHDHAAWGLVGMLRGAELSQNFRLAGGQLERKGKTEWLAPGEVAALSPNTSNIHRVSNAFDDRVSVSIHVYGTDFGQAVRTVFPDSALYRSSLAAS